MQDEVELAMQAYLEQHMPEIIELYPEVKDVTPELFGAIFQLGTMFGVKQAHKVLEETTS